MRKHGWQLPYHPLQVVAVAVFIALGFAFYVFFAPFVGKKLYQYIAMGLYSPLILCVFGLYIWCTAADPADPGVFKSKKYLKILAKGKFKEPKESNEVGIENFEAESEGEDASLQCSSWLLRVLCFPCSFLFKSNNGSEESSDRHMSEDGMFYCSLCEVEAFKCSKHCRVCDKCVDSFDHHCRWLNNCIGKKNYREFFTLMVFSLLVLVLQWSTGVLVLICCFLDSKRYRAEIASKLGSSFTIVPYVIVVVIFTILAMVATLPLAQLFFFHILLIKKGLSTYDYIIALREQEQQAVGGQQSPQMSQASSLTGLSSVSSFNTFHRAARCTPPRLFMQDQFDVVPQETGSVSSYGKRTTMEERTTRKNPAVKISPWALARLNAEELSKAASEARKKSKILHPISSSRNSTQIRLPSKALSNRDGSALTMAPFQLESRSGFQSALAMPSSAHLVGSSPESSLESPDLHPCRVSSSGAEESRKLTGLVDGSRTFSAALAGIRVSRSTSDDYEASGDEDSDRVATARVLHGEQVNWSRLLSGSNRGAMDITKLKASTSSSISQTNNRNRKN